MIIIRAGIPALVGAIALLGGIQQALQGLEYSDSPSLIGEVRGGLVPIAVGLTLLLVAMAIARRTRLGYLLGLTLATVSSALGVWFFLTLVPHAADGGFNLAPAFMVFSGVVVLVSIAYGAVVRAGRSTFAEAWGPNDRRFAIVLTSLLVASGAAFAALGAVQGGVQGQVEVDTERARALVAATTVEIRVTNATVGANSMVEHLGLEVVIRSATNYQVDGAPTLCLTDILTATEVGKLGVLCWGADEPGLALTIPTGTVPTDGISFNIQLDRGHSICAYLAGQWSGSVGFRPAPAGSEVFYQRASFIVEGAADASPAAGGETPVPCGTSK